MTPTDALIEKMARAIANANGDVFEEVPESKTAWIANRGFFRGRYRDVNEPFQADYEDMARAAYEAEHAAIDDEALDRGINAITENRVRAEAEHEEDGK